MYKTCLLLCGLLFSFYATAQSELDLEYRNIGPHRGGRVTAVAGVAQQAFTFYFGSTGGGVWKTTDAGTSWANISDGFFECGSVGAVAVAPSDPNVLYVGTGSADPRGNVSAGCGIYKSTDAGSTWGFSGLPDAGQIGKIEIHPQDPDVAYVAVLGNLFGASETRGVYRTLNGGQSWEQVHYVSPKTGAIDLVLDPSNPRILYAAMWTAERKPWTFIDGSEEGGVWKSTNGGDSWSKLEGLPNGQLGRIGLAVSPVNSQRLWVLLEAKEEQKGGLYRSEDGGKTFQRINREHELRQRAWYYTRVFAHPIEENTLFVVNVDLHKSIDGGKTFDRINTPHSDNHVLWINPEQPELMIEGNDGGACISLNGGQTWSTQYNQPTAEFYRVTVDNQWPYRVYGAQQDNSTISVASRGGGGLTPYQDWYAVGGGESGHIAVDPENPDLIYAGTYIGVITRLDRKAQHQKGVTTYPQMHDGTAPRDIKYRHQWNAPIRISPHDRETLYHCSQYVHRSVDGGYSWEIISPDLTTNKDAYQDIPGEPIQHDHTGVELYTTIFAFEESPHEQGLLWAGSDDGRVHLSKDNGKSWEEITPKNIPVEGTVNTIECSPHAPGRALLAVYKYRENDFRPYILLTNNYGKSWELLTDGKNGIPEDHFVRVVREDPIRKGLLYAGTEFGMYYSKNEGKSWTSLQLNLPVTPITDMVIKDDDLVIATQGRSFWILDQIAPLRLEGEAEPQLPPPASAYRSQLFPNQLAADAPRGAVIDFYLPEELIEDSIRIEVLDPEGTIRKVYSSQPEKEEERLEIQAGHNRLVWNLRYESPEIQPKAVFSLASTGGIRAMPGQHTVRLVTTATKLEQPLSILLDPRWSVSQSNLQENYTLTMKTKDLLNDCHGLIGDLRSLRKQIDLQTERLKELELESETYKTLADTVLGDLRELEEQLIQFRSESGQDPINYPPKLDDQIAYLYSVLNRNDDCPTKGAYKRFEDLKKALEPYQRQFDKLVKEKVSAMNEALEKARVQLLQIAK